MAIHANSSGSTRKDGRMPTTEHDCPCTGLTEVATRVAAIDRWRSEYEIGQRATQTRLFDKIDELSKTIGEL